MTQNITVSSLSELEAHGPCWPYYHLLPQAAISRFTLEFGHAPREVIRLAGTVLQSPCYCSLDKGDLPSERMEQVINEV